MIRLAGQGTPGIGGSPAGICCWRCGSNRILAGESMAATCISPCRWRLGGCLGHGGTRGSPDGPLKVRIPEGAQSGQQLRVRGGHPANPPGDLLLDLRVVLPPADTQGRGSCTRLWRGNWPSIRAERRSWTMRDDDILSGSLMEDTWLTLEQVAAACTVEPEWLARHIDDGLFPHVECLAGTWRFPASAWRGRDACGGWSATSTPCRVAALMADLMEELDTLRRRLPHTGPR